ncbi:MAG TPA: ankyrin repeat domain-containing protein [Myxococcales bacterium]
MAAPPAYLNLLLEAGAPADASSPDGETLLLRAVRAGASPSIVEALLAHGARADGAGVEGQPRPLEFAVGRGFPELVPLLLAKGAHPELCPGLLAAVFRTSGAGAEVVVPEKLPPDLPERLVALAQQNQERREAQSEASRAEFLERERRAESARSSSAADERLARERQDREQGERDRQRELDRRREKALMP